MPRPVAEEPVAEEPVAAEPVAEETVAEEPVVEEPVAETEEPTADDIDDTPDMDAEEAASDEVDEEVVEASEDDTQPADDDADEPVSQDEEEDVQADAGDDEEITNAFADLDDEDDEEIVSVDDDPEMDAAYDAVTSPAPVEAEAEEEEEPEAEADETPQMSDEDSLAAMKAAIAEATQAIDAKDLQTAEAEDAEGDEEADKIAAFEPEETGDAAFDRILGETNSRMDDSEGNRRRSAIAHLKAAVAATKADRLLKRIKQPEEKAAEEQSQYRDDLAHVVRPNRPAAEESDEKTERPKMLEEKSSPLMLVSELRVDEEGEPAEAIAPRRVEGEEAGDAEYDQGFAEFAQQMGAVELPDLLEAAAAYSAFVEGQKEFSRPQLMRRVASVDGGDHSREQGLRSFGQLLRQGKIQKLKRGQFTITTETRFNPEARIAGE